MSERTNTEPRARRVILDVDTGTDDAVAIMFAALHPDIDLMAVTTVNGNVPVEHCTDNSLRVLDFIGRSEVPVYEGLAVRWCGWTSPPPNASYATRPKTCTARSCRSHRLIRSSEALGRSSFSSRPFEPPLCRSRWSR